MLEMDNWKMVHMIVGKYSSLAGSLALEQMKFI